MSEKAKLKKLLDVVISEITPSSADSTQVASATHQLISKLNKHLRKVKARAIVAGSSKKNTQLKGVFEIDIFVMFNYKKYSSNDKNISEILARQLRKASVRTTQLHGSRDYYQTKIGPYTFEIVPILDIKSSKQAKNITDVSPLHARWLAKHSKNKLNEIRLTKAFLTAAGIYGAESYVSGLSGYACEILTIHYGSFIKFLKAAAKWNAKEIIDPENFYKSRDPLQELNKSKTTSPLIVVDPVQPSRNVTAALSEESFNKLVKTAASFLKNPSKQFFTKKIITKPELLKLKGKDATLLILEILPERNKTDVMGAAVLNKYKILHDSLLQNNFKIVKSSWAFTNKPLLWFLIGKKTQEYEIRVGPSISDKPNTEKFKRKHKKVFVKKGRLYAKAKPRFAFPKDLVRFTIKQKNFKTRIKSVKVEWH